MKHDETVEKEEMLKEESEQPEEAAETTEAEETAESAEPAQEEAEADAVQKKYDELYDKHLRTLAEYDNYKRRTQKEKDEIYLTAQADTIGSLLPVLDNLERAVAAEEASAFKEGIQMIVKQLLEILEKQGVSEIEAVGCSFDPNFHNAVMHVEDETLEANTIAEQFQKGYKIKDRVIRHSMVKVAN